MRVVLTYGTFDLFHFGHIELLEGAKALGDYLIVGLSTDDFNAIKGKTSVFPYKKRKDILENLKYVDLVIPENDWDQKVNDIKKYNVDVVVMGSDWKNSPKFEALRKYCDVQYIPRSRPFIQSYTTTLKEHIKDATVMK